MKERDLRQGSLYEYRYHYKSRRSTVRFYCILALIVIAAFAFRIYWTSTFGGVYVDGNSMNMTLMDKDELLMKYGPDAERGDVIVLDVRSYGLTSAQFLIKRLIATEGDALYCEKGVIHIRYAGAEDFVELDEPYAYYDVLRGGPEKYNFGLYEVGEGEIFFLGDNRHHSQDSRYKEGSSNIEGLYKAEDIYGVVPAWSIRHKSLLRYLPGMRVSYS